LKSLILRPAYHALWLLLAAPACLAAPLTLHMVDALGKDLQGAVITLRSTDAARPLAAPLKSTIDQVDLKFTPPLLVIPAGSSVNFPNSDKVRHQVYSFSEARRFSLPLYSGRPYPPVEFDRPGIVTIGCNIHDQMRAYLYVVEAQYFGRSDAAGTWREDVQPGEYIVQVWYPLARDNRPVIDQKLTVTNGGEVKLRLATPLKLRPVSQVPPNWDAY